MFTFSHADCKILIDPARVSIRVSAISSAAPFASSNSDTSFPVRSFIFINARIAGAPRLPNLANASAAPRPPSIRLSNAPMPFASISAAISESTAFSPVPARSACMPASERVAIIAVVSSRLKPRASAMGATCENATPSCSTLVFARAEASAKTSATLPASLASKPIPRTICEVIAAASASSSPPAAARSSNAGVAAIISFVLNPALARSVMPSAASLAENIVVRPSINA